MLNWHGCLFHWQNRELTNKGIVKATKRNEHKSQKSSNCYGYDDIVK